MKNESLKCGTEITEGIENQLFARWKTANASNFLNSYE
jgi:hypothetical protein